MTKTFIFELFPNPSTDYYIIPALSLQGIKVQKIELKRDEYPPVKKGSWVFIVRYLSPKLLTYLVKNRKNIERLIYFMDDGLWDIKSISSLPLSYALRIFRRAYVYKYILNKLGAEIWVSTDYLAKKYAKYNPKVVYPYPLGLENVSFSKRDSKVIFYHGTSSHKEEFRWLKNFFSIASKEIKDVLFEVVLDDKWAKTFRGISGLVAIRPMNWQAFYKFSSLKYRCIGLVPLFENEFNKGRSWIKFYDITRGGAVGIYSENAPYANLIRNFQAGLVLPMREEMWLEAIRELIINEDKRKELFDGAMKLVEHLRLKAIESYKKALLCS